MREENTLESARPAASAKELVDLTQRGDFLSTRWSERPINRCKNAAQARQFLHERDKALNGDIGPVENMGVYINCKGAAWVADPRVIRAKRRDRADEGGTSPEAGGSTNRQRSPDHLAAGEHRDDLQTSWMK
jgi:hypothetical protein